MLAIRLIIYPKTDQDMLDDIIKELKSLRSSIYISDIQFGKDDDMYVNLYITDFNLIFSNKLMSSLVTENMEPEIIEDFQFDEYIRGPEYVSYSEKVEINKVFDIKQYVEETILNDIENKLFSKFGASRIDTIRTELADNKVSYTFNYLGKDNCIEQENILQVIV